ncbi:MAG: 2OG-Fe(II) oxygenase [Rhodomicrobium sp.]
MTYPLLPRPAEVAGHFVKSLSAAKRIDEPYRRWQLANVFPEAMCTGILTLPIAPPVVTIDTKGARATFNNQRTFFTPRFRELYPAISVLCGAMQRPEVARQFEATCGVKATGGYLRMEYIQDLDGMWLEPHRDIPEKLFSMVIYLCTGPFAKDWGTDIYDHDREWCGRGTAEFNSAVIFIAGPHTWHGFEPRPIHGVRRLMEINYVRDWRDREQLAFPDRPIEV